MTAKRYQIILDTKDESEVVIAESSHWPDSKLAVQVLCASGISAYALDTHVGRFYRAPEQMTRNLAW